MNHDCTDDERTLLDRAARWPNHASWRDLTAETLRGVAMREGLDFATALLYDRLARSPEHGPLIRRVPPRAPGQPAPLGATVAIVPGACYVEYPHTGADGRRLHALAARWGCRIETIPIRSCGTLAANARTICSWLRDRADGPLFLVSLSKGGADVKTALARPDAATAFRNVAGWVDLGGILFGTALAGWFLGHTVSRLLARLLCWYRGYPFGVLKELDRRAGGPLDGPVSLPAHLAVVHLVAFPLARHLSSALARRSHRRLAPLGPSDGGGILLGDVTRLPGRIYPVWGADHYLRTDWDVCSLVARILAYLREVMVVPAAGAVVAGGGS